jgi:hypothetical protein
MTETAPFWISLYIYEENFLFFFISSMLFSNPLTKMDSTIRGAAHSMDAAVRGAANSMDSTLRGAANTAANVAKDAAKDVAASTFPRATEFTLEYLAKVSRRFQRIYSIFLSVLYNRYVNL